MLLVITSATSTAVATFVQIRPRGLLGEWVKYDKILFIYLYLFSGTHLQVRPVDRFSRLMAQMMRTRARMCLLGVSLILLLILGVKSPPQKQFWGLIGVFKQNVINVESFILSKLLHRFQPNFAQR